MAKRTSGTKARRKREKVVTVKSKTYGEHERAPRGTYKKAELNDAMKLHGERVRNANEPARLINNALLPFRENFRKSQIWPRLVAHFARQAKRRLEYSAVGIPDMEIDQGQPASKTMIPHLRVETEKASGTMGISVSYTLGTRFLERGKYVSGFQVTIIVLFPDFANNEVVTIPTVLPVKLIKDRSPYVFFIDIPPGADSYLLCFKADPCKGGKPDLSPRHAYRVMKILDSGKI